jgi:hypothetical protein
MSRNDEKRPGWVAQAKPTAAPGRQAVPVPPVRWPNAAPRAAQPAVAKPGAVQPKPAGGAQAPGRVLLPVVPSRRCAPPSHAVVQREIHYRHFGTKQKFFLSRANSGCGRAGTAIFLRNENGDQACLRYSNIGADLVIEHVEAAGGAARGTGALLVFLAAKEAVLAGGIQCYIGMGTREPKFMNFWTNMGFDMTTVSTSAQPILLATVRANAKQRIDNDGWEQSVEKKGCFLSTACTAARGLPDDCEELTVLRRFREEHLRGAAEGESLLRDYDTLAPRIVAAIDERPDALAVYERIYAEVALCVRDIQGQDHAAALDRYRRLVEGLAGEMLMPLTFVDRRSSYPPR